MRRPPESLDQIGRRRIAPPPLELIADGFLDVPAAQPLDDCDDQPTGYAFERPNIA
ncbi:MULTISPECIES: hypothetical protein [unclassified Streptomyces]|uniref:hypothetical protein n=1 Tax=unclassified Streptomyces TaxID=2593676 RepID=UPI0038021035